MKVFEFICKYIKKKVGNRPSDYKQLGKWVAEGLKSYDENIPESLKFIEVRRKNRL